MLDLNLFRDTAVTTWLSLVIFEYERNRWSQINGQQSTSTHLKDIKSIIPNQGEGSQEFQARGDAITVPRILTNG